MVVCVNERLGMGQRSCAGSGSQELISKARALLQAMELDLEVTEQVCLGRCQEGITMRIAPGGPFFTRVTEQRLAEIINALKAFTPQE